MLDKLEAVSLLEELMNSGNELDFKSTISKVELLLKHYAANDKLFEKHLNQLTQGLSLEKRTQLREAALNCLVTIASMGNADAQYLMGKWHEKGFYTKVDLNEAVKYYKAASDNNHLRALKSLGRVYCIQRAPMLAIESFNRAINMGAEDLWVELGIAYHACRIFNNAEMCFQKAREKGDTSVKHELLAVSKDKLELAIEENNHSEIKKALALGVIPELENANYEYWSQDKETIKLLFLYGIFSKSNIFTMKKLDPSYLYEALNTTNDYFVALLFIFKNTIMPRELYVPIIITMANFKEALSDAQYCTLTLEAEEAKIVQTICQKRDEKNNQKDSWDKFFSSSSFPANPTINNIIAHAFSTGNFTKSILRDLKYINDNDELEASAPRLFKKLYTDYMSNKDCKVNNTYVFGSWF